jgi:hypothetical protein
MAAENGGPLMHARIGMLRALNRHVPVGERDHLKVLSTGDAAEKWFEDNDLVGVAFEYEVQGYPLVTAG